MRVLLAVAVALALTLGGYERSAAQVSGTTYTSPAHGYTVTWQSPWYVIDEGDDPAYDSVSIVDSDSFVYFAGSSDGSTPQEILDLPRLTPEETIARVEAVTIEDMLRAAERVLTDSNLHLAAVGPLEGIDLLGAGPCLDA